MAWTSPFSFPRETDAWRIGGAYMSQENLFNTDYYYDIAKGAEPGLEMRRMCPLPQL